MNTPKVGSLITSEVKRDAFHIAVAPVIATERLAPGQKLTKILIDNPTINGTDYVVIINPDYISATAVCRKASAQIPFFRQC